MIDPMTSDTSILTYQSGYSLANPLPSNPPLTFNTSTGELCFTPQQPFVVTIAFLVSTFRNGVPIGQIERDFLYYISPCSNNQPQLSGINGTDTFNLSICANELNCFNVFSSDSDITDSTFIFWDNSIPAISFSTGNSQNEYANFCWTPGLNDVDSIPYCFNIYTTDNNCHGSRTKAQIYCITVTDPGGLCINPSVENLISSNNEFVIYPHPAKDFIFLEIQNDLSDENLLIIKNIFGETVYQMEIKDKKSIINFDKSFVSGIYFAELVSKNRKSIPSKKLIVFR